MTDEQLADLIGRLNEKATQLNRYGHQAGDTRNATRLFGKASGVHLAVSFLEEMRRG